MSRTVTNSLKIIGKNTKEILKSICSKNTGEIGGTLCIDFNKIEPEPRDMPSNVFCGTETAVNLYLTSINPFVNYFGDKKVSDDNYMEIINTLASSDKNVYYHGILSLEQIGEIRDGLDGSDSLMSLAVSRGEQIVDCAFKYGHTSLENWRYANWGTNKNARSGDVYHNMIDFTTEGYDVRVLVEKLSKKYPNENFYYAYADSIKGTYSGSFMYENGVCVGNDYSFNTKKTNELYSYFYEGRRHTYFHLPEAANLKNEIQM